MPNVYAKTDDQYGRALKIQNAGAGIVVTDTSHITAEIDRLCDDGCNRAMRENLKSMKFKNGADEIAKLISGRSENNG